jgi:ABC-type spermidine/putrescine transport system permease subunit II
MKFVRFSFVSVIVFLTIFFPLTVVVLLGLAPRWGYEVIPTEYSLAWWSMLQEPKFLRAILNTIVVSGVAVVLSVVFGIYVSYILTFYQFRGKELLSVLVMSPIYVASIVIALGLLTVFGFLRNTPQLLIMGLFIVVIPIAFRPIYAVMQKIDPNLIEAAESLGASRFTILSNIILPLTKSGIIAGAALTLGLSMSEIGVVILLYGPSWYTMAVQIFIESQRGVIGIAAAMGTLLILIAAAAIIIVHRLRVEILT